MRIDRDYSEDLTFWKHIAYGKEEVKHKKIEDMFRNATEKFHEITTYLDKISRRYKNIPYMDFQTISELTDSLERIVINIQLLTLRNLITKPKHSVKYDQALQFLNKSEYKEQIYRFNKDREAIHQKLIELFTNLTVKAVIANVSSTKDVIPTFSVAEKPNPQDAKTVIYNAKDLFLLVIKPKMPPEERKITTFIQCYNLYRKAQLATHPDTFKGDVKDKLKAEEEFIKITAATVEFEKTLQKTLKISNSVFNRIVMKRLSRYLL